MANTYASCRTALFPGGVAIQGVVVALYTTGGALLTLETTDAAGLAFLGDRAAGTYEIRVTANGVVLAGNVQSITVVGADDQAFDVLIDVSALPVSTDARFCRVSGHFVQADGRPAAQVSVHFHEQDLPQLLRHVDDTTRLVIPSPVRIRTNAAGYAVVDLLRGAVYAVLVEGYDDGTRLVDIPDTASAPLPDVLFPTIARVEWQDGITTLTPTAAPVLVMAEGDEVSLEATTVWRSGRRVPGHADVELSNPEPLLFNFALTATGVVLQALAAGNATLEVVRRETNENIRLEPTTALKGTLSLSIT